MIGDVVARLVGNATAVVLDIGCGPGSLAAGFTTIGPVWQSGADHVLVARVGTG